MTVRSRTFAAADEEVSDETEAVEYGKSMQFSFAGMIFRKEPFFYEQDNQDQLVKIAKVLGTEELGSYLSKYRLILDPHLQVLVGRHNRKPWTKFMNTENKHLAVPEECGGNSMVIQLQGCSVLWSDY